MSLRGVVVHPAPELQERTQPGKQAGMVQEGQL